MSRRHPLPHSHPGRPIQRWSRPLPPLLRGRIEVQAFCAQNPAWKPLLDVCDRLCAAAGSELYGGQVMGGGLVLANRPDVAMDEGVILVYASAKNVFSIHYRHRDVQAEQMESCTAEELWERLRLFLAYKFGVRVPKDTEEQ